jgi:hypothetical protein
VVEGEDKNKKDESKGFAGLSSLVSDVDTSPPPAAKKEPTSTSGDSSSPPSPPSAQTTPPQPQPRQQQTYQEPSQPSSGSSGGKWVLGIAAVIGVLWLIGQADKPTTSSAPTYSPPVQSAAPSYSPPEQSEAPSDLPSTQPEEPSRPVESEPPIGQDIVLSTAQIRYCLAEDIRLNGAKSAVNNYIDADVERFNAMVADYNSRCSSFQYHTNNRGRNDLMSAQRDIEPYRSQLQAEGRSRFERSPSAGSLSAPVRPSPALDGTIQAIQSKLNGLGYDAGSADGLMSETTRSAILAFQRDKGLAATGMADQALLFQLQRAPARSTGDWYANDPVVREAPAPSATTATATYPATPSGSEQRPGLPANAYVMGSNWYCKEGFRKAGNECEALVVPQNAYVMGSNWYCKEGFRKVGNECEALVVPQNAYVMGSNWYCKEGFRKAGNECEALVVPQNAYVMGSNWYCKEGFRKIGNECEALVVPQNAYVMGSNWYCKEGFRKVGNECVSVFQQ